MQIAIAQMLKELIHCPTGDYIIELGNEYYPRIIFRHSAIIRNTRGIPRQFPLCIIFYDTSAVLFISGSIDYYTVYEYCDPAFPQNLLDVLEPYI